MALLNILNFPDPRLRTKASQVTEFNEKIITLTNDMLETMYAAPGIGLAATQINVHQRIITIDISEEKNQPLVVINPEIIEKDGEQSIDEGCLSVPGIYEPVKRFNSIRLKAQDQHGEFYELDAEELLSVCIQHEIDHLEGKLFVDYLSEMKRNRIRKKILKAQKSE